MFKAAFLSLLTSLKQNAADQTFMGSLITVLAYTTGLISTPLFWVLVFFSAADYIFGTTSAIIKKELDWDKCFEGIIKKLYIGIVIFLSALVDFTLVYFGINTHGIFHNFIMASLIGKELGSTLTNMDKCGLWVPKLLRDAAKQIKKIGSGKID